MTAPTGALLRYSRLRSIATSPAHYRWDADHEREDTPAMELGRAVHSLVLGGPPVHRYEGRRAGKDWDAFRAAHSDGEILTADRYDTAARMAENALRKVNALFANFGGVGVYQETEVSWQRSGFQCGGRVDFFSGPLLIDLKTTSRIDPRRLAWQLADAHYHCQLAWYAYGLGSSGAAVIGHHYLVVVESAPPYCCVPVRVPQETIDIGNRTVERWLDRLRECEKSGIWPGHAPIELLPESVREPGQVLEFDDGEKLALGQR